MAIARDNITQNQSVANSLTLTFSHTVSGTNRILFVAAGTQTGTISGVTYNSVAMTQIQGNFVSIEPGNSLWYLIAPATGANNVVVTRTATANTWTYACASSYTGVVQTSPIDISVQGTTSGSSNLTTTVNNDWAIVYVGDTAGGTPAAGTNSTAVFTGIFDHESVFDTNGHGVISPAGSFTMNFTPGNRWIMAAFSPSVAPPVNSNFLAFM